ncbi:MAG: sulfatase-like hydrolase/transferase [Acidobacteriota bacterium]
MAGKRRKNRRWILFVVIPAVAVLVYFGLLQRSSAPRPSIVLITIDTLRADYVGAYGNQNVQTPYMDALAADGVLFETVVSEVPLTLPAHSTLMTGAYPPATGVHDNLGYRLTDDHLTIAEVLKKNGYSTGAFVGAYVLDSKWGLAQGFDHYDDHLPVTPGSDLLRPAVERAGHEVSRAAQSWIESREKAPFFCWIHLFDPHHPYEPPEPFRSRYAQDLYAGEVAYADQMVGQIIEALKRKQLYEETLIVVAGDHGESLGEHEEQTHGFFIYDSTLRVPLILKLPVTLKRRFETRSVVDELVQLADVSPTLLQILNIDRPESFQGYSLLEIMQGGEHLRNRGAYSESYYPNEFGWSELKAWRTKDHKFILSPKPELYDLRTDPGETRNIIDQDQSLAARLERDLLKFIESHSNPDAARAQTQISGEELARLQALGYVGAPSQRASSADLSLPDPKDKRKTLIMISEAMEQLAQGQFEPALTTLERVTQLDPAVVMAHSLIGQAYLKVGRYQAARDSFERVVQEQPDRVSPVFYLGLTHFHMGEQDRARELLENALRIDPQFAPAHNYLGLIYTDRGESVKAIKAFSEAVRLQPNANAYQMLGFLYTQEKQLDKAARALQKAVELDPNNAIAHLYLANAYMLQGQRGRAQQEFETAAKLDPSLEEKIR